MSGETRTTGLTVPTGADRKAERGLVDDDPRVDTAGSPHAQLPTHQKRVYIVDDESSVRQAILYALQTAGYVVRPFASGRDFLDATGGLAPGCVLLDLRMPELGGLEVLDELREQRRKFPCIAITGHGDVHTAVESMKRGARDFLEKPFTDPILLQALEDVFLTLEDDVKLDIQHSRAVHLLASLSRRERETLQGLVGGLSNKAVAFQLGLSVRTVEMHRGNLKERLGVKSIAEATSLAILAGLKAL